MKKVVFEYDLDNEDDKVEFDLAYKAGDYNAALFDILQLFRNKLKYGEHSEEVYAMIELLRSEIGEVLYRYNIEV